MSKVNVYDENRKVVARVPYNNSLDVWDGSNFYNGGIGRHLGIERIKSGKYKGRYALIYGTDWTGERDYAELVSDEEALQAVLKYNDELLESDKDFAKLRDLAKKKGLI